MPLPRDASVARILASLSRWRRIVWVVTLVLPVATGVTMVFAPDMYTAEGTILIEPPHAIDPRTVLLIHRRHQDYRKAMSRYDALPETERERVPEPSRPPMPPRLGLPFTAYTFFGDLYEDLLASRRIRENVALSLGLVDYYGLEGASDGDRLERTLRKLNKRVKIRKPSHILLRIQARDPDPAVATLIVNEHLRQLRRAARELGAGYSARTWRSADEALRQSAAGLDSSLAEMARFQEQSALFSPDLQVQGTLSLLESLQSQLLFLGAEREALRSTQASDSPRTLAVENQMRAVRTRIDELMGSLETAPLDPMQTLVPLRQIPEQSRRYRLLFEKLNVHRTKHARLAAQIERARIHEAQFLAAFDVLDWGQRPYRASGPRRLFLVAVSLLSAALTAVMFVRLLDDLQAGLHPRARSAVARLVPTRIRRLLSGGSG